MRISGQKLETQMVQRVELPRVVGEPISLTLQPLSLGFHRQLQQRGIVKPVPPRKVARGSDGKPMRDEEGLAIQQADAKNPIFLEEMEQYHQRVASLIVWEALQADPSVTFECKQPGENEEWIQFADQLWNEFQKSGFTAGDLIWLCDRVSELSNLTGEHLRAARTNFFSATD